MKRILCLVGILGLCACDRPDYDVLVSCHGNHSEYYLIHARLYKSHADLDVTRLSMGSFFSLRENEEPLWFYNQVPEIDDTISVRVPSVKGDDGDNDLVAEYRLNNDFAFQVERFTLAGGLSFMVYSRYNAARDRFDFGYGCEPVLYRVDRNPRGVPADEIKRVKACVGYLDAQRQGPYNQGDVEDAWKYVTLYDTDSNRHMRITREEFNEIIGTDDVPSVWRLVNDWDSGANACEMADRLREYISAHIDAEYIPDFSPYLSRD